MAEPKKPKSGGGCFSKLLLLILLAAMGGLATAVFFVVQPQDLTDLGGYGPAVKATPVRDMKAVLQSAIDRNYAVTLSEAEINQWIASTLVMKQGGLLADPVKLEHFWVRLEEGHAELIMERSVFGMPFTISMYFKVDKEQSGKEIITSYNPSGGPFLKDYEFPQKGGRLGKLVVPQGFLHLVLPSYEKIAALFNAETELAFSKMQRVKFENDRIVLDPRETLGDQGMPQIF
ncbi:MAG: hypothetical protein ABIS50_00090 [Luteolibacter sp.]|uniref:hypothetical protein n=1 Tax=Luteolibacter sp. TaxID=1962973 RepID=UPI0032670FCE